MKAEEMALFKHLLCKFEALNSDPRDPCGKPSTGGHTPDPGDGEAGCRACLCGEVPGQYRLCLQPVWVPDDLRWRMSCDFHTHTWAPMYEHTYTPYTRKFIVRTIFRKSAAFHVLL